MRCDLEALAARMRDGLKRVADWWSSRAVDPRGGFYGAVDSEGRARADADKSLVLNARILWFFSAAAETLGAAGCKPLADRARDALLGGFRDAEAGGFHWMLDAAGRPIDTRTFVYGQAFALYGLAMHARAFDDAASASAAAALFDLLEAKFRDPGHGGYVEALGEAFAPLEDMRLSDKDLNAPKSMNAHLHLMEAYAELLRVREAPPVREALTALVELLLDRIVDRQTGNLRLFFERDWTPLAPDVSWGHEIEASWLLCDAAETLGDPALAARVIDRAVRLADQCERQALGPHGEFYETPASQERVWWVQAEALVGCLNAYELTGEPRFLDAALKCEAFIARHQVDAVQGEWRALSDLDEASPRDDLAGPWKCPYHNGRAYIETARRLARLARD